MANKRFFFKGKNGDVELFTYDTAGNRVNLYYISTIEEARAVCDRLNAAILELCAD